MNTQRFLELGFKETDLKLIETLLKSTTEDELYETFKTLWDTENHMPDSTDTLFTSSTYVGTVLEPYKPSTRPIHDVPYTEVSDYILYEWTHPYIPVEPWHYEPSSRDLTSVKRLVAILKKRGFQAAWVTNEVDKHDTSYGVVTTANEDTVHGFDNPIGFYKEKVKAAIHAGIMVSEEIIKDARLYDYFPFPIRLANAFILLYGYTNGDKSLESEETFNSHWNDLPVDIREEALKLPLTEAEKNKQQQLFFEYIA